MSKTAFAKLLPPSLLLGALLAAGAAQGRVESLRWGHVDPAGQDLAGYRLYQKTPGGDWGPPLELPLASLTSPEARIYTLDVQVGDGDVAIFALTAYDGSGLESVFSPDEIRYPASPTAEPGGSFLGNFRFGETGAESPGWFDSGANNSFEEQPGLFGLGVVGTHAVLKTGSDEPNIHSHYVINAASSWTNYEYRGRMRTSDAGGGVGVTAYSAYPDSDAYYRVRATGGSTFHFAPHPHGSLDVSCHRGGNTGVVVEPDTWYRYRLRVATEPDSTVIRARVWAESDAEPSDWPIDCLHAEASRLAHGTVGVWSYGSGEKYWDDLEIEILGDAQEHFLNTRTPPPPPVLH